MGSRCTMCDVKFSSLPWRGTRTDTSGPKIDWVTVCTWWVSQTQDCYFRIMEEVGDKFNSEENIGHENGSL